MFSNDDTINSKVQKKVKNLPKRIKENRKISFKNSLLTTIFLFYEKSAKKFAFF